MRKNIALLLAGIGMLGALAIVYLLSGYSSEPRVFSPYSVLISTWEKYKQKYIQDDGRVIDFSQNDITTSEGQSYAMLRAVWSDDRKTFDLVWNWTKDNLRRPDDALFGWRWGEREDSSYGFIENGGSNFASDADSDIALALLFAARRWDQPEYEQEAKQILEDLWELSTEEVNNKRYFLPGDWASNQSLIILNPSYFMPYSWRIFAATDTDHDWQSLVDPAYEVLRQSSTQQLAGKEAVGLPPNWVALDKPTGKLIAPPEDRLSTNYSYDAMRIPWRIAVDYHWYQDSQALEYLETLTFLKETYQDQGRFTSTYAHDGKPLTEYESPVMYATALGYFITVEPELAEEIYNGKIISLYSNDDNTFISDLNYYDENWLWFSTALYNDQLPNLAAP